MIMGICALYPSIVGAGQVFAGLRIQIETFFSFFAFDGRGVRRELLYFRFAMT
jgi:hypothetical protein